MKNFFFCQKFVFYSMYYRISNKFFFTFLQKTTGNKKMESIFPQEIINLIYGLDPTKRNYFDKVIHQLRMRQVWYQIQSTAHLRYLFPDENRFLSNFGSDNPTFHETEEMFEYHVNQHCRYHRVLGNKPRLPFDQFDLVAAIGFIFDPWR